MGCRLILVAGLGRLAHYGGFMELSAISDHHSHPLHIV